MDTREFADLIGVAIEREVEAQEFYRKVADRATDKSVKQTFAQLSREEGGHRDLLETYKSDPTLPFTIKAPVTDFHIAEAEALPVLTVDMKPIDAIALAMKKEQQAVEFYRRLAQSSTSPEHRQVFDTLTNMELGHKHRLENMFVDTGYPEVF
jgi:rubrerythrin